jgi:hypothetical protein
MNVPELDGWLSEPEVASWLGVTRQRVHQMIKQDKIQTAHRIGRGLVISTREAIKLLGDRKRGRLIPLDLPSGGVVNLPCERVPELIFWCRETAEGSHAKATFTQAARGLGVPEAAEWSADRQYIPLNPPAQRGVVPPDKVMIADYLLARLLQA